MEFREASAEKSPVPAEPKRCCQSLSARNPPCREAAGTGRDRKIACAGRVASTWKESRRRRSICQPVADRRFRLEPSKTRSRIDQAAEPNPSQDQAAKRV